MNKKPGYSITKSGSGFKFKAHGGFDLRDAPELQAIGLKPQTIAKPDGCGKCNAPIPWHLFEIGDERFTHICSCRSAWKWTSATTAAHAGKQNNPFADYDEAQKVK